MKLLNWITLTGTSLSDCARAIKVSPSTVHKYLYDGVIPKPGKMRLLYALTHGAVTPNDFHDLSLEHLQKGECHADAHA